MDKRCWEIDASKTRTSRKREEIVYVVTIDFYLRVENHLGFLLRTNIGCRCDLEEE